MTRITDELIGLRNMAQAAWVVTRAAWHNHQSRGAHYREDSRIEEFVGLSDVEDPWGNPHELC
ncbi:MAG: hypothetical protein ACUVSJ_07695 [Anaerolineae bacterium]